MNDNDENVERKGKPIDQTEEDLCRCLWLAVAVQALIDASGKGGNSVDQSQAREWLKARSGSDSEFATVCDLAGIDFERTRNQFEKVLKQEVEPIDFRCMKKAYAHNRSHEDRKRFFRRAERNARNRTRRIQRTDFADLTTGQAISANDNFINQPMEKIV